MVETARLNKVIDLLERGQPVFSSGTVMNGHFDDLMAISRSDYDMAIIETEHQGFDFLTLRHSLQYLVNRKRIADKGQSSTRRHPLCARAALYTRVRRQPMGDQTNAGPGSLWPGVAPSR